MENSTKQGRLQCTFPKLTEANQHYILGIAEGLKFAQGKKNSLPSAKLPKKK